ncbi:hypothetical protein [Streptomyces sp. NPDC052012]|uniref:hypothetical protein n=1 Tax=Streptomyces sp. NPDC052012 TaxID=3155051 RepID=UPI003450DC96
MTHDLRHTRRGAALLVSILCTALIAGCSSGSEDTGNPSKDPEPSPSSSATAEQGKLLEKQVERALGIGATDGEGDLFVESGLERVSDGIHTNSVLTKGGSYTLSIACSGAGEVRLTVMGRSPVRQTVACDSVPARHRITDAPAQIKIDAEGLAGSSGMVGWRIDELAK